MSTHSYTRVVTALGSLLLIAGAACRASHHGNQNTYSGTEGSLEVESSLVNSDLASRLKIVNPRTRRLADGRLQVQFDLQNTRSSQTEFAWTVDWFDDSGFLVETGRRSFEPMNLGGGAVRTLKITAPTPASASWRLSITSRNEVE